MRALSDFPTFCIDFLLQLAFIAGLVWLSFWLWPDGLLEQSLAAVTVGDVLLAVAAMLSVVAAVVVFYWPQIRLGWWHWTWERVSRARSVE